MASISFSNSAVLLTGASSGIGLALARRLAGAGAMLYPLGRDTAALATLRRELGERVHPLTCNLDNDADIEGVSHAMADSIGRLDILVHCAGIIALGELEPMPIAELDLHYRLNVRAPLLLTQRLLPLLKHAQGQLVFINSSVGVRAKPGVGAYAASKHALKAIADTLRDELNASGVRVLSVFPGNTATPMQQRIQTAVGNPYLPETMLQPDDVALSVINALSLPRTAEVTDIHIRPFTKSR
jgi:NADP-dependent 3-hydroxy acid dehydrogenase YdfG